LQEVTFTHGEAQRHADAKGHYHLLVHTNGTYHVTYSYPGHCSTTLPVTVGTGPQTSDVVLGQPGIPSGVTAVGAGDNAIDVSWQVAANADQYRVYRSLTAGGPYTPVALVPGAQISYHDTPVSGVASYYYVVRAIQGCESANSAEAHATTSGACSAGPAFAGLATVQNAASSTCALNLACPAGTSRCGGGPVTYRIYRSTTSPFTPSPANALVSGISGNSFSDHDTLASFASYAYVVRAVDAVNGTDDGNTITVAASPTGANTVGTWTDNGGDTGTAKLVAAAPWSVLPTGGKTAPRVYATGTYGNGVCAALTTPAISLQNSSNLTFASKYDFETAFDLGIVEVATGPSYASWTKLSVNYPDALSNSGNACGIPTSGAGTVFSRVFTTPAYSVSPYTGSLAAYGGKSVKLRWRFGSDSAVTRAGWWVDDIAITNAVIPGTCSTVSPNPKEASPEGHMTASRGLSGTAVSLAYAPGCGMTDNAVYWGSGPIGGSLVWTNVACDVGNTGLAAFDPGDPAPDGFIYFVIVGQTATKEGSYGPGASGERPEANGIGPCDKPQDLTGTCP
jgi:hypothetical protein